MKTFTLKDFINYNNPCFSCGEKISFRVFSWLKDPSTSSVILHSNVTKHQTEIELIITYATTLKLIINHISNKIITTDMLYLTEYLETHTLHLGSICNSCYTTITSTYLEFNLQKGFLLPTQISKESLILKDNKNYYQINSSFIDNKSTIIVDRTDKVSSPIRMNLPLLPLYKLKTKERCLQKIKTYILFS
jgi:hypothetical protein